jgi:group I intron endonuclease
MNSGIYKLHWLNCNYFYYGQTINFLSREKYHTTNLKNNRHYNKKLQNICNKYGLPMFTIVEKCNVFIIDEREQYFIDNNIKDIFCCNIAPIANSCRGIKRSESTKEKIRLANIGTKKSQSTKDKIALKKLDLTTEQRVNISNGQKGKKNPQSQKDAARSFMLNVSKEYRENMGRIKKGTYMGADNHSSKLVIDLQTGIFYDCLKDAANSQHYKYGYLKMMLSGRSKNKTNFIYC